MWPLWLKVMPCQCAVWMASSLPKELTYQRTLRVEWRRARVGS
jgi:hypothetical protein